MSRDSLNEALQIVKTFAEKRGCMPILSNVLIQQVNGQLELITTDLESAVMFTVALPDYSFKEWKALVPVHILADLIKAQGGDPILRPGEHRALVMETAEGERTIGGYDPDDFPAWERSENEEYVIIPVDTFLELETLPKTADNSGKRYGLDNVNFRCTHYGEGKAETTDGHRLATVPCAWLPEPWNFMIPARQLKKAIAAVKKIRKQLDDVELFRSQKGLTIIAGPMEIWLRFAEGDYPDTSKLEPDGFTSEFKTKDFTRALYQCAALFRNGPLPKIPKDAITTMNFTGAGVEMWSSLPDVGSAYTFVSGETGYMIDKTITFNVGYVLDAIRKCNGTVRITSNDQDRAPWKFGEEIVMPMTENLDRPDCAPKEQEAVKELPRIEQVLPVEAWRLDPNRDPGPGFEWEPESDYFPAHWARVA